MDQLWNLTSEVLSRRCAGGYSVVFTVAIGWLVTGSAKTGLTLGLIDFFVKIGTFYAHERVWQKIQWGRLDSRTTDIGGGI